MADQLVWESTGNEDGSLYIMARILKKDSSHNLVIAQQSDFTSMTLYVYDSSDTIVSTAETLTISSVFSNTLSTGTIWTKDSTGFNFIVLVAATYFPLPDTYRISIKFVVTGGPTFWIHVDHKAIATPAS